MTPKERADSLRRTADAIEADAKSKLWDFRFIGEVKWRTSSIGQEIRNLDHQEYRPTPDLGIRPWTRDEVSLGCKVVHRSGVRCIIVTVFEETVVLTAVGNVCFDQLFREWKQLDTGEPCGFTAALTNAASDG